MSFWNAPTRNACRSPNAIAQLRGVALRMLRVEVRIAAETEAIGRIRRTEAGAAVSASSARLRQRETVVDVPGDL